MPFCPRCVNINEPLLVPSVDFSGDFYCPSSEKKVTGVDGSLKGGHGGAGGLGVDRYPAFHPGVDCTSDAWVYTASALLKYGRAALSLAVLGGPKLQTKIKY